MLGLQSKPTSRGYVPCNELRVKKAVNCVRQAWSIAVAIQAHRPRYVPIGELRAEKVVNSDRVKHRHVDTAIEIQVWRDLRAS